MSRLKPAWQTPLLNIFRDKANANQSTDSNDLNSLNALFGSIFSGNRNVEVSNLFGVLYSFFQSQAGASPVLQQMNINLRNLPTSPAQDAIDRGNVIKFITLSMIAALYAQVLREWLHQKEVTSAMSRLYDMMIQRRRHDASEDEEEEYDEEFLKKIKQKAAEQEAHQDFILNLIPAAGEIAKVINDTLHISEENAVTKANVKMVLKNLEADLTNAGPELVSRSRAAGTRATKKS